MCTNPLIVNNNSPYKVFDISPKKYQVPCGHCLECRSLLQSEWCIRLSYEINMFYRNGGIGVFLTLSYNDDNLPIFEPLKQPAFNHDHILKFLDDVNRYMQRTYGMYNYKYFLCSEYGKTTQRPHYHVLFLLSSAVDWHTFTEKCRVLWSYGFLFPKFDGHNYVDNDGLPVLPTLKCGAASASYVSKYITKDLSFYGIPSISDYLDKRSTNYVTPYVKRKKLIKKYLPKHWQSKGIGLSQLDYINMFDKKSIHDALLNGVYEPLSGKVVPLTNYLRNKLSYKNVRSDRRSELTGKYLYDRYLTDFGEQNIRFIFDSRVKKDIRKFDEFIQTHSDLPIKLVSSLDLRLTALYKLVYRYQDISRIVDSVLTDGDLSRVYDVDLAFTYFVTNKDTKRLKNYQSVFSDSAYYSDNDVYRQVSSLFCDSHTFLSYYESISFFERFEDHLSKEKDKEKIRNFKRKFFSKYDTTLC